MKPLLAVLLLPTLAHASWFDYEAGIGVTYYQTENGRWYQNGMPSNRVVRTAPEFSLGLTGAVFSRGAWGVDWHAGYVNLGRAAASCQCDTSDADYVAHTTKHTAYFSGDGRSQGVALTLEPYYWYRGLRFGIEGGAYVYRFSWSESVGGWSVGGPPVNLYLSDTRWGVSPVAGVSVGNGVWSVTYRHYFMKSNNVKLATPPVWNDANVLEIKYKF